MGCWSCVRYCISRKSPWIRENGIEVRCPPEGFVELEMLELFEHAVGLMFRCHPFQPADCPIEAVVVDKYLVVSTFARQDVRTHDLPWKCRYL